MTSATLGGASTLFGGPALAIIAAATSPPAPNPSGPLDLLACVKFLLPTALLCFGANLALLALFHRHSLCHPAPCALRACCCVGGGRCGEGRRRDSREQELSGLTRAMAGLVAASAARSDSNGYLQHGAQLM